jgi:transposase
MIGMQSLLQRWNVDERMVRERMYGAPTPRERERWHALWLLVRGWSEAEVATALERDAHTIGAWVGAFGDGGPASLAFEQSGGSPPPSTERPRPR